MGPRPLQRFVRRRDPKGKSPPSSDLHPCYSPAMKHHVRLLAWAPATSAALMILAIYCSWATAYVQLGRRPRPNIDDPDMIGGFFTELYDLCLPLVFVLFVIWTITSAFTLLMADSRKVEHWRGWGLGFVVGLIAFGLLCLLFVLRSSPGDAIEWFFD